MAHTPLPREPPFGGWGVEFQFLWVRVCVSQFLPWSHFLLPWPHTLQAEAPCTSAPQRTMRELSSHLPSSAPPPGPSVLSC